MNEEGKATGDLSLQLSSIYTNWNYRTNEPSNSNDGENCIGYYTNVESDIRSGYWNDIPCYARIQPLCELTSPQCFKLNDAYAMNNPFPQSLPNNTAKLTNARFNKDYYSYYLPKLAIDGILDKKDQGQRYSMAQSLEKDTRLFVDLVEPCKITQIAIYPVDDCCPSRYFDMKVYLKHDLSIECEPIYDWSNDIGYIQTCK